MKITLASVFSALYRRPVAISICGIILTLFFAAAIPGLKFDNDIKNFLALDHPHRLALEHYDRLFGTSEIIIIGVESEEGYSAEAVEYVSWLKGEIEKLNWRFPGENISSEFGLTSEEAGVLIDLINRNEIYGTDALKELLTDPAKMNSESFIEIPLAEKISRAVKKSSVERVLQLYKFPADKIKSCLDIDYIRGEGNRFVVEKLIDRENINTESVKEMRKKAESWEIYDKLLFSSDGRITVLSVQLNRIDINLRQKFNIALEKIIKENPRQGITAHIAGEPVLADRVSSSMGSDLQRLLPFVLLLMFVILLVIFRNFEGVLYPMIVMIISVIWTLGTMAVTGIPMSMVSITMPIVLTAVASAYGIHFMTHYFMNSEVERSAASLHSIKTSGMAIIMAALTTVAGFGSLASSDMTHIKNYGIITAIGVFYSLIITLVSVPGLIMLKKSLKPAAGFTNNGAGSADMSHRFLMFIRERTGNRERGVLGAGLLIVVISLYGLSSLKLSMNSMDFFQEDSEIKVSENRLNSMLAGTQLIDINIQTQDGSEVITPEILSKVENFQREIKEKFPDVGKSVSVNDYLKKMNREMHGGSDDYYRLPESAQMTREYLLLYSGDLDGLITKNMDTMRIHLNIKRGEISGQMEIRDYALAFFDREFREHNRVKVESTGYMDLMMEANLLIIEGQIRSLLSSLLIVALLMFLIFRSVKYTAVSLIPLAAGIMLNFGVMGILNIPLNAATALVASIAIGMGIDYSIHFISRYRTLLEERGSFEEAVEGTYSGTGRAILSNMLSVMAGFAVLLFSEFPIIRQFGGLIAFTVGVTGVGAIILIPAALKILRRFEYRKS